MRIASNTQSRDERPGLKSSLHSIGCLPSNARSAVESYDGLNLADVYAIISDYLSHPEPIDAYLRRREKEAEAVRAKIEASRPPRPNLCAILMARARAKGITDVEAESMNWSS